MKKLIPLILTFTALTSPALAMDRYRCEGEIGNGCGMTDACYEVHGTRSYAFALDCHPSIGDCTYTLNNDGGEGVRYKDMVTLDGLEMGHFIRSTQFLSFKISEGDSYTQRWFNGICTRID